MVSGNTCHLLPPLFNNFLNTRCGMVGLIDFDTYIKLVRAISSVQQSMWRSEAIAALIIAVQLIA